VEQALGLLKQMHNNEMVLECGIMHLFIVRLLSNNDGCTVKSNFLVCPAYADDITLVSPSVKGLQQILNTCVETGSLLLLKFIASKYFCF
jgi:hypothetical protein